MLTNTASPDDPILEPICMPGRSVVYCAESSVMMQRGTRTPRLMIDQSAIVWKPALMPQPKVGQQLLNF